MKLIIDNGATKAIWVLIDRQGIGQEIPTPGIPPYFTKDEEILETAGKVRDQLLQKVDEIFFYSTGCKSPENRSRFAHLLGQAFPGARRIEVDIDILAAARALCQREPGIACILGTGSNSCYYDGRRITANRGGLGFILGDEGSGAALGKYLLSAFINEELPIEIKEKLLAAYPITPDDVIEGVYRKSQPSRFLAGFAPFILEHLSHPFIHDLASRQFRAFFKRCVLVYEGCRETPVHFTGSISSHFREIITQTGQALNLHIGRFLSNPIEGLVKFHSKQ